MTTAQTHKPLTRRQQTERGQPAAPETPQPAAPEATPAWAQGLIGAMTTLTERMDNMEAASPSPFVPQYVEPDPSRALANTYVPPETHQQTAIKSMTTAGQTVTRHNNTLENPKAWENIPAQYHPAFRSNDLVRINPDAPIWGGDGKLWSEVLAKAESDGLGEVLAITGLSKTWEPMYTVRVNGLTRRTGVSLRETELLPQ